MPDSFKPTDYSWSGSPVHEISQARTLEWVVMPSFKGSSRPRDQNPLFLCLLHWQAGSSPLAPPGNPIWSSDSTPGHISRQNYNSKRHRHPVLIATLFIIVKTWTQHKCSSMDEWIKKMWCIGTTGYYSAIKKNEIMPFVASQIDLEHNNWSKSETERQIPHESAYMWHLKYDTNKRINEKEADSQTENRLVVAEEEGVGKGWIGSWHQHGEWIHKVLPQSTENYTQYSVINHNRNSATLLHSRD